jgi:polyhydroxyalkanoate synthesis repressor PhaR
MEQQNKPVIIKKYPNRRLYNTQTSDYITLEDLYQMVRADIDFTVIDAKTAEDLTRMTLTQIIFEQEAKGYNILPINFLRQLIAFYDDRLRLVLPHYLEASMKAFSDNKSNFGSYTNDINKALGTLLPWNMFEEVAKQNISIFEKNMNMFFVNQDNKKNDD